MSSGLRKIQNMDWDISPNVGRDQQIPTLRTEYYRRKQRNWPELSNISTTGKKNSRYRKTSMILVSAPAILASTPCQELRERRVSVSRASRGARAIGSLDTPATLAETSGALDTLLAGNSESIESIHTLGALGESSWQ